MRYYWKINLEAVSQRVEYNNCFDKYYSKPMLKNMMAYLAISSIGLLSRVCEITLMSKVGSNPQATKICQKSFSCPVCEKKEIYQDKHNVLNKFSKQMKFWGCNKVEEVCLQI